VPLDALKLLALLTKVLSTLGTDDILKSTP
jgi:hypothetical protein